mmetsp:Transcript_22334/g.28174  ORF Transcript_22334/g.28174 Transcript_22334/m.28174 type:complete len:588 (-) Transcript_22334:106-1869(-)
MKFNTKVAFLAVLEWNSFLNNNVVNSFSTPTQFSSSSSLSTRAFTSSQVNLPVHPPQVTSRKSRRRGLQLQMASSVASGTDDEEPLIESFGKGILRDYKARLPLYGSDIKDGLNTQCLAATLFLFFACLSPAVGFGGLFAVATDGAIGTIEMVSSTAACGFLYALFSAQPLTIIGSTGPVLAFVATLVQLAKKANLPFLPLYTWTGLWTSAILFLSSVTSASNMVKYLTRFTDEIFAVLISTIFVVEAASDIGGTFMSPASTFTKALLTLVIATVTYGTATTLKGLRNTVYFTKSVRNNISNFAPTIGVVLGSLLARKARLAHGAQALLPSLSIPTTFQSTSGRPWLVPLFDLPVWARWGALLPALMATVLLYLDQNITVRVVNNPSYKMEKGRRKGNILDGMHADMLVISICTFITSLIGFPWLVAATVRSISHVRALSKFDKDGKIQGTVEQRITGMSIHALIGSCVIFDKPRALLTQVPSPVLMGLFMYLGTSALPGNEMFERIVGLFKDKSLAKKEKWSSIPKKVVNGFTMLQVACLGAMFWVKSSPIGVLFPVIIALLAPLRFGLEKFGIVKKEYMDILDEE